MFPRAAVASALLCCMCCLVRAASASDWSGLPAAADAAEHPRPDGADQKRQLHAERPLQRQPAPGHDPRDPLAGRQRADAGHDRGLSPRARGPHRPHLALRASAPHDPGPGVDRPQQGPLGAHHGAAQPRAPHELLRADLGGALRPAPAAAAKVAPAPVAGAAGGSGVRRPGHVDLVPEPVRRRQPRLDRRPGARGRREHVVRQELRRVEQLLESVQPRNGGRATRERPEGVRLAVRLRDEPRRRGEPRRESGRGRRGLPGDRRRGPVRRSLRLGRDLYRRPARRDRARLPPRPRVLPVRL